MHQTRVRSVYQSRRGGIPTAETLSTFSNAYNRVAACRGRRRERFRRHVACAENNRFFSRILRVLGLRTVFVTIDTRFSSRPGSPNRPNPFCF